jgi:SAM-dependent MidA family methyltransferase
MTPLGALLTRRIAATGPITLADYMAECLLHPVHGYYATRDPLGAAGDFTTAPEISQMFGELVGLALAQAWLDQGAPRPIVLAEAGPGRGTLMADILRAGTHVPGFVDAAQVHLVEASPVLRAAQARSLAPHAPRWHDTVADLPDLPLFAVANEFFDALPIRQFVRQGAGWSERMVTALPQPCADDRLGFGLGAPTAFGALEHRLADTVDGDIVETCAPAEPVIDRIASAIATRGGAALIVDYGDWRSRGDTFQALRRHEPVDPFAAPGTADLTAHVDFEAIARVATRAGAAASPLVPQGVFLERLGITARAMRLAERLSGPARDAHVAAHRRLTHPDEMGSLFKCLAISPPAATPFPGTTT